MKRFYIFIGCLAVLAFVFLTSESHFEVVKKDSNSILRIVDPQAEILFVGDIMLGRRVESLMSSRGSSYPFIHISDLLSSVDFVAANLEGPIMSPHVPTPELTVRFSFASTTARVLADNNIKIVSLANNHLYDHGVSGYQSTGKFLGNAGVLPVGHPYAFSDTYTIRTNIKGQPFIFVAFNFTNPNFNTTAALDFVRNIERAQNDFLVIMVHGGEEYVLHSNTRQQRFYRGLVDAGADTVIAHHPHVVQEIELYKDKLIFYSLGNFIFDQYFSKDVQEGLAVKLTLSKMEVQYELIPIKSINSQPQMMDQELSKDFLARLAKRSSKIIEESIQQGMIVVSR